MDWHLCPYKIAALPNYPSFVTNGSSALDQQGACHGPAVQQTIVDDGTIRHSDFLKVAGHTAAAGLGTWPLNEFAMDDSPTLSDTSVEDDELRFSHWLALGDSLQLKHLRADQEARFKRAWAALIRSVTFDHTNESLQPRISDESSAHGSMRRSGSLARPHSGIPSFTDGSVEFCMGWSSGRRPKHRSGTRRRSTQQRMTYHPDQDRSSSANNTVEGQVILHEQPRMQIPSNPASYNKQQEQQEGMDDARGTKGKPRSSCHMDEKHGSAHQCVICLQARACMAFTHGGTAHNCCCKSCVDVIAKEKGWDGRCPMCRQHHDSVVQVFDP
eukprot:CAMPEP_0177780534 /NCGR_PEP_ID=MMETSP0491_2-20121128/17261_1 /TAXON_ID=63592 /ORGANISM="Tetraselmis chuii, Strain PLY429" /LENGTH=327 /DNA_ID=CAMNT_0019300325 /DNA_START=233 /DNA_END=1216 /DNA_ORIENTATION=-